MPIIVTKKKYTWEEKKNEKENVSLSFESDRSEKLQQSKYQAHPTEKKLFYSKAVLPETGVMWDCLAEQIVVV